MDEYEAFDTEHEEETEYWAHEAAAQAKPEIEAELERIKQAMENETRIDYDDFLPDGEPVEDEEDEEYIPEYDSRDGDAESALASAGHGTDEDYNCWEGESE